MKRITFATPWLDASRREIEQLVGRKLRPLPRHEELYARVKALGGGNTRKLSRPVFEAVALVGLPAPHNLFKCGNAARFRELWDAAGERFPELNDDEIGAQAGREFMANLTVADREACSYHHADWKAIADESVRILHVVGRQDLHRYVVEAQQSTLGKSDRDWLVTLFEDPIEIVEGGYSNGQHRGCALRFSGADRAAMVVDAEILGETCDDWVYEGGG